MNTDIVLAEFRRALQSLYGDRLQDGEAFVAQAVEYLNQVSDPGS